MVPCTFSQRQGYVTIVLEDGTTYELTPSPTEAATYTDQDGQGATMEDGLGSEGLIYRLADESIFVYWDPTIGSVDESTDESSEPSTETAESSMPVTYITEDGDDELVMQITEGEFNFHGYLERTSGNMFQGEDDQVRVMYDRDTGRIVVINAETGDEFYNYFYSEVDEGAL